MKRTFLLALLAFVVSGEWSGPYASRTPQTTALFIGSSTIAGWGTLAQDFPEFDTINLGRGGSTYLDMLRGFSQWIAPLLRRSSPKPRVLLYSGDNDLAQGTAPGAVLGDLDTVVQAIHRERPDAIVFVLTIKISPARIALRPAIQQLNRLIREKSDRTHAYQVIELQDVLLGSDLKPIANHFAPDGLHLSPLGYQFWRDAVRKSLVPSTE